MQSIKKTFVTSLQKYPLWWISGFFVLVNGIFNFPFLKDIVMNSPFGTLGEDTVLTQYFGETSYQLLKNGQNPFQFNSTILYPFGTATVLGETGTFNAFFFFLFRPFLNPYAALLAVVCLSLLVCQFVMYALLRYLKVDRYVSAVFAVVYAFSPFVSVRIQYHFNYVYHFLFPLVTLLLLMVLQLKTGWKRYIAAIGLGVSGALLLYNTLYYVAIYLLFIILFCCFYALTKRDQLIYQLKNSISSWKYLLVTGITFLIMISPFLMELNTLVKTSEIKQTQGWGGAIEFSANALDLFIPSEFNPLLGAKLKNIIPEKQQGEQIIYPGAVVLVGVLLFIWRKRKNWFHPLLLTAFSFYVLSLGPFLHFWKYWNIRITETLLGVIPLPYILLKKIPLFAMMRSPVRFGFLLSFCLVLVAAFAFNRYIKSHKKQNWWIIAVLVIIFFADQFYIPKIQTSQMQLPTESYKVIKADSYDGPVLELPYVIQDGFFYWGKVFHSYPMIGQHYHQKPVIGGYLARVPDYMFHYYMGNPFLGYYGFLADNQRKNPEAGVVKPSLESVSANIDLLGVKYVIVKESLPTFAEIHNDFTKLGFKKIKTQDNGYTLFARNPQPFTKTTYDLQKPYEAGIFGNWSKPEVTHRWLDGNYAGFFVRDPSKTKHRVILKAVAYKVPRTMHIRVNRELQKTITIDTIPKTYTVELTSFTKGLNSVEMKLDAVRTKKLPGEDNRNLSVQFMNLELQ